MYTIDLASHQGVLRFIAECNTRKAVRLQLIRSLYGNTVYRLTYSVGGTD